MEKQYLLVHESDGSVFATAMLPDPDAGPTIPPSVAPPGMQYVPYDGVFSRKGRGETEVPYWKDGGVEWVETATLDQHRAAKADAMRAACEAHITAGFLCSALGEAFLYPAKAQDQANLVASVTDSLLAGNDPEWRTPFWCMDSAGQWEFRPHTISQIQQVGREGKAAILAALSRNEILSRQIAVANAEQLPSIAW